MEKKHPREVASILLGRPFLQTFARTKIDVYQRTLSMEVDGKVIHFNIFKTMQRPHEKAAVHAFDTMMTWELKRNHCAQVTHLRRLFKMLILKPKYH